MDEYRSKSFNDAPMEIQTYYNGNQNNNNLNNQNNNNNNNNFQDLRCYSASYATSNTSTNNLPKELKKGKSGSASSSSSSSKAVWCFGDPELQRKKRVASYKSYTVEGKLKRSFSKSFRWIKDRYSDMVHGS